MRSRANSSYRKVNPRHCNSNPTKVLDLYLELSNDRYHEILDYLDDIENDAVCHIITFPFIIKLTTDTMNP